MAYLAPSNIAPATTGASAAAASISAGPLSSATPAEGVVSNDYLVTDNYSNSAASFGDHNVMTGIATVAEVAETTAAASHSEPGMEYGRTAGEGETQSSGGEHSGHASCSPRLENHGVSSEGHCNFPDAPHHAMEYGFSPPSLAENQRYCGHNHSGPGVDNSRSVCNDGHVESEGQRREIGGDSHTGLSGNDVGSDLGVAHRGGGNKNTIAVGAAPAPPPAAVVEELPKANSNRLVSVTSGVQQHCVQKGCPNQHDRECCGVAGECGAGLNLGQQDGFAEELVLEAGSSSSNGSVIATCVSVSGKKNPCREGEVRREWGSSSGSGITACGSANEPHPAREQGVQREGFEAALADCYNPEQRIVTGGPNKRARIDNGLCAQEERIEREELAVATTEVVSGGEKVQTVVEGGEVEASLAGNVHISGQVQPPMMMYGQNEDAIIAVSSDFCPYQEGAPQC